jgi:peptidoglycan/xylan/chitin deacetylase (PgdA/CDA1 family)
LPGATPAPTTPRPTTRPSPSPLAIPTATVTPVATPVPTPSPTAPPPPRDEPDACPPPPADVTPAPVVAHGDRRQKIVALTFDDGFDPENTRRILGILKRYHVNATFFPTGRAVLQAPEVWREVAAAGFPIGDHSYSHPTMSDLCYAAQLSELKRQARAVRTAVGIRVQPYMRPPYEAWNRTTRIATRAAGQRAVVIWNIDTKDWAGSTVGTIRRRALHGDNGAIVLMHTQVENTALALPDIIRGFRARGFRFVTIGQVLGIDGPVPYR